jgi:hypothetical protein
VGVADDELALRVDEVIKYQTPLLIAEQDLG